MGDISEYLKGFKFALEELKIRRIIHSLKINSFESISERFTLTYMNLDSHNHHVLPLPALRRITQRSLKVFDRSNNELTILPSYEIHTVLRKLSVHYLTEIVDTVGREHDEEFEEKISELRRKFRKIFIYGNNEGEINDAIRIFEYLSQRIESLTSECKERCMKFLRKLGYLVTLQKDTYIPFVELKEPFCRKKHYTIHYVVETTKPLERKKRHISPYVEGWRDRLLFYVEKWRDRLLFYVAGEINPSFSLLPASVPSYHLEIKPPKGIDICGFKFEDLEGSRENQEGSRENQEGSRENQEGSRENSRRSKIIENKRKKDTYFDKELLYITFSPEETKEIRKRLYEGETPVVTLNLKINSLLRCLYYLVYMAIFSPLIIRVVQGHIYLPNFIASLALAATIYISASIYAMDKNVVQKFALFHLFATVVFLFVEIIILEWLP